MLREGASADWPHPVGGWTALHIAAAAGQAGVVMWLVQNGADPCTYDEFGKLAEEYAVENGHLDLGKALRGIRMKMLLEDTGEPNRDAEPNWFDPNDSQAASEAADMDEMQSTLDRWKAEVKSLWRQKHAATRNRYLRKMDALQQRLSRERTKHHKDIEASKERVGRLEGKLDEVSKALESEMRDKRERMQHIRALTEQLDRCRGKLRELASGVDPMNISLEIDQTENEAKVSPKRPPKRRAPEKTGKSQLDAKHAINKGDAHKDKHDGEKIVMGLQPSKPAKCAPSCAIF